MIEYGIKGCIFYT